MENRIKSAIEIAMEKAAQIGELAPEEAQRLKWVPEGERLAARYLEGATDLREALVSIDRSAIPHVLKGLLTILLRRLELSRNDVVAATNKRILETLRVLCEDRKALEEIIARVAYVEEQFAGYGRQQIEASYQKLKEKVTFQIQQQLRQQGMTGTVQVDVTSMPEFQAQWRAAMADMEQPYEQNLDDLRKQLRDLILAKPAFY
ncbi:hypothetical protein ACFLX9_03095 [Chloroflexota bacterium]